MKSFLLAALFLFLLPNVEARICDPGQTTLRADSEWKTEEDEICISARCKSSEFEFDRKKCIHNQERGKENTVVVSYSDWVTSGNTSRNIGRSERITINKEDQCFNACTPEKKFLKSVSGLDRKSCLECFKNRTGIHDETLNYPELGRTLYKGTKCHQVCRDKEGPITNTRTLTAECQQCIGLNGIVGESFQYLQTRSGTCQEFDQNLRRNPVDPIMCRNAQELIHTTFERQQSWGQMFSGSKGSCYELDDKTFGDIYKVHSDEANCDFAPVNSSEQNKDKVVPASPASSGSGESSRQ